MRSALLLLVLLSGALPLAGCQAVADFDRGKIPTPGMPDPRDGGGDDSDSGAQTDAAGPTDMPVDSGVDGATGMQPDASDDDAGDDAG